MAFSSTKDNDKDNLEFLITEALKTEKIKEIEALAKAKKQKSNVKYLFSIAASMLLIIGLGLAYQQGTSISAKETAIRYISETNIVADISNTRSLGGFEQNMLWLKKAQDAVYAKEYSNAILYFDKHEKIEPLSNIAKLNYAFSILNRKDGNFSKSEALLKSIGNVESGIKIEAIYLLGLNEVLLGNDKEAVNIFQQLLSISDYRKAEAETILKKLK